MIGNRHHWRRMFTETFAVEISAWRTAVIERLLPTFENLADEADAVADAEFNRLGQSRVSEDSYLQMDVAADLAHDKGLAHYERMDGVRQGLLNLATAGVHHLFEQQVAVFVCKELITLHEEHNPKFITDLMKPTMMIQMFKKRLSANGIDHTTLPSYAVLRELQLVANVVKHGSGKAAEQLVTLRPLLFTHPMLRETSWTMRTTPWPSSAGAQRPTQVDRPLSGNDIYVTPDEFQAYAAGVVAFWGELADVLGD